MRGFGRRPAVYTGGSTHDHRLVCSAQCKRGGQEAKGREENPAAAHFELPRVAFAAAAIPNALSGMEHFTSSNRIV